MNLVTAGALGGLGAGMQDVGNKFLQYAMFNKQMEHQDKELASRDKWREAMAFKKIVPNFLGNDFSSIHDEIMQADAGSGVMPAPGRAGRPLPIGNSGQQVTQVARMLPNEQPSFQAPSALALAKF